MKIPISLYTVQLLISHSLTFPIVNPQILPPETFTTTYTASSAPRSVTIANVTFLGDVHSTTTFVKRDLGFQGRLGPYILLSYGDTLSSDEDYSDTFRGITSNSVAFATHDPLTVFDPIDLQVGNRYPEQFVKCRPDWGEDPATWAVGITNVIETSPGKGMLYYLLNHRPGGENNLVGAGIALVSLDESTYPPRPLAHRKSPYIWSGDHEPWFGDVSSILIPQQHHTENQTNPTTTNSTAPCSTSDPNSSSYTDTNTDTDSKYEPPKPGYVYTYGHKKDNPWVYLARVPVEHATQRTSYEYWHGAKTGWSRLPLDDRTTPVNEDQSIFWQVNQGQVIWNAYLRLFLFVYCDAFWSSTILLRTSSSPEGPWSGHVEVYKATPLVEGGTIYAAVPHDYFDPGGKTMVVTFTNHPNWIQAVLVEFE